MIELLLNTNISFYIGAFVQWGFLMAFLYSLVSSINNADKSIVWLSFIMALSYSSSIFIDMDSITYFDFTDLTMVLVFFIGKDILKLAWLEGKLNKVFNKRAY